MIQLEKQLMLKNSMLRIFFKRFQYIHSLKCSNYTTFLRYILYYTPHLSKTNVKKYLLQHPIGYLPIPSFFHFENVHYIKYSYEYTKPEYSICFESMIESIYSHVPSEFHEDLDVCIKELQKHYMYPLENIQKHQKISEYFFLDSFITFSYQQKQYIISHPYLLLDFK